MKTAHDIKLLNGSKQEVTYPGVETVTMPGTDGTDKVFTAGAPIDAMDIQPDFSGGDMPLEAPEGYVVRGATIKKPEGAEQVIAKGQTVAGITGEYVTPGTAKEIIPDFRDYLVVDNQEDVSVLLSDRVNIGKYVKYTGETGDYISGRIYKVVDEYEAFDPNSCPATAVEVTSDTSLTATLEGCDVGDLVVAAFAIRSDLVSLSDGWTLISTSQSTTEINPSNSFNQTLSFAYKYATSTTEELTVTQTTAARLYINMVSLSGVSGFADAGYQYQDNTNVSDLSVANFARPAGRVVIWGATNSFWGTNRPYRVWELSNDSRLIQIGSATQSRLLLAIDKSEDVDVTFYSGSASSNDAYICGALSIELNPAAHLVEVDKSEVPTTDTQTVAAEGDERWSEVTVKKPETLVPENIPKGVEIAGVVGAKPAFAHYAVDGTGNFEINDTMFDAPPTYVRSSAFLYTSTITSVTLTEATGIGASAFYTCTGLTTASFPVCTSIGSNAFTNCYSLADISFPACSTIGSNAFYFCQNLSQASFPACTTIGSAAFYYCTKLSQASFPVCASIASSAFYSCPSLAEISFPVCTSIGITAFNGCRMISQASFPACTTIGSNAFTNCYSLEEISFPSCTIINKYAFGYCSSLSQAVFPRCTTVGVSAFTNCPSLAEISFPVCTAIGDYAFRTCKNLSQASFPACTTIASSAFQYCYGLISLYLLGPSFVTLKAANVFYSTPISTYSTVAGRYGSIFVRESMLASYKASSYWSLFSARMVGLTDEEIAALDAAQEEPT